MRILALDLAEYRIGWALGEAGSKPVVDVFKLRDKDERTEEAIWRLGAWLYIRLRAEEERMTPVKLLVAENYIPGGALKGMTTFKTRDAAVLLNGAVRGVCGSQGVAVRCPYVATVRVHFCGKASAGDRDATKNMVIRQAHLLGYIPKDCWDDDMADAAALFDFASSHWGRTASAFKLVSDGA